VGIAHEVGDTPSGRSGEAVSLQRGFDGARAGEPEVGSTRAPFIGAKRRRTWKSPALRGFIAQRPVYRRIIVLSIENYAFNRMLNHNVMIYNDKYQFSLSQV
jgi:hypothetical protein